jgi:hypothetical protein
MSAKQPAITINPAGAPPSVLVVWTGVTESDTFAPVSYPEYTSKSVHFYGTFGGATATLKGSNTGANFFGLGDPQGVAISMTSEGLKQAQENALQYQPTAAGGSSQSLSCAMLFVKTSGR